MARPKGMSKTTLYGIVVGANAALFFACLKMGLIDGTTFLGGVTLGTTIGTFIIGLLAEDEKKSKGRYEDLQNQIEELKNKES